MASPGSPAATPKPRPISRVSALDLMQLAIDAGTVSNQVGAVLVLDAQRGFDPAAVVSLLGERIERVPKLWQRLVRVPVGYGRPVWVDDPRFDLARHVTVVAAPGGRDDAALLDVAAERVTAPLPTSRVLWSATLVTGLAGARVALIVVYHHVLVIRILAGPLLVAHGLVHLIFLAGDIPEFKLAGSWLLPEGSERAAGLALLLSAIGAFSLAGLAVWGVPSW